MALIAAFVVPHPPIIVAEIGRGEEAAAQETVTAMREVARQIVALEPDVLVLVSPHAPTFADSFFVDLRSGIQADDFSTFGKNSLKIDFAIDTALAQKIIEHGKSYDLQFVSETEANIYARRPDHGCLVPLYFIGKAAQSAADSTSPLNAAKTKFTSPPMSLNIPLVRLAFSGLDAGTHFSYGVALTEVFEKEDKRVVFIASGDLSHKLKEEGPYGFAKEGPAFDEEVAAILDSGELFRFLNFDEHFSDNAAECGLRSFQILAGLLDRKNWTSKLLSYEGPYGVGYAVAALKPAKHINADDEENAYPALARRSLEHYLRYKRPLRLSAEEKAALPDEMTERQAAVFVSIHKDGDLRGCIGTLAPTTATLADEIIQNAISAGTKDPRFPALTEDELRYIDYSVDVLGEMETVTDRNQLDAQRYGVVVSEGWRRGLLLPALEGVDTVEEQLHIACMKAGISPHAPFMIERFEVHRYEGLAAETREV